MRVQCVQVEVGSQHVAGAPLHLRQLGVIDEGQGQEMKFVKHLLKAREVGMDPPGEAVAGVGE